MAEQKLAHAPEDWYIPPSGMGREVVLEAMAKTLRMLRDPGATTKEPANG